MPTEFLRLPYRDRNLAEALLLHEDSRCSCGCGQPSHLAHDPDTDGWWKVRKVQCSAGQAIREAAEDADGSSTLYAVSLDPAYVPRATQ